MAKAVLPYQCTGTSSSTIRTSSHAHHQLTNTITFLQCSETDKQETRIIWSANRNHISDEPLPSGASLRWEDLEKAYRLSLEKISVGRGHHKPVKMKQQRRRRSPEINIHSGISWRVWRINRFSHHKQNVTKSLGLRDRRHVFGEANRPPQERQHRIRMAQRAPPKRRDNPWDLKGVDEALETLIREI